MHPILSLWNSRERMAETDHSELIFQKDSLCPFWMFCCDFPAASESWNGSRKNLCECTLLVSRLACLPVLSYGWNIRLLNTVAGYFKTKEKFFKGISHTVYLSKCAFAYDRIWLSWGYPVLLTGINIQSLTSTHTHTHMCTHICAHTRTDGTASGVIIFSFCFVFKLLWITVCMCEAKVNVLSIVSQRSDVIGGAWLRPALHHSPSGTRPRLQIFWSPGVSQESQRVSGTWYSWCWALTMGWAVTV